MLELWTFVKLDGETSHLVFVWVNQDGMGSHHVAFQISSVLQAVTFFFFFFFFVFYAFLMAPSPAFGGSQARG